MLNLRGALRLFATLAAVACASTSFAQATRIVVGGPPGGNTDLAARLVAQKLGQQLGTTVVIENKPGAGGTVAAEAVRNAKPDGTTIGLITASNAANESLQKKSFDLTADLETVGLYAWLANVLIIHPSIPAKNVTELIAFLKTRPAINYSSGGPGSPGHLSGETFKLRTGLPLTHIPYKGAPPAVTAVMTNEVSFMFATASAALPQVKAGTVRALAVTSAARLPALPDVPTFVEAGLTGFDVKDWVGFVVPRGTPMEVRDRLHRAFSVAFADPAVQKQLEENTMAAAIPPLSPAEFQGFLKSDIAKWAKVIKDAGIEPQ